MDPITTIIVTVLANAIVTGVIVYLIQKRIERSYARQMEEFKADLQYSNFEQQTKFARSQEKRVEALEGIYEKFLDVTSAEHEVIDETKEAIEHSPDETRFEGVFSKHKDVWWKLNQFWQYYAANRLYLPESIAEGVSDIWRNALIIDSMASRFMGTPHNNINLPVEWVKGEMEGLELEIAEDGVMTPYALLDELSAEMDRQTRSLEKLYKSVAEAQ